MEKKEVSTNLLSSKETKAELKINDCDLAHHRNAGKLKFVKTGNSFMYLKSSIKEFRKEVNF